MISLPADGPSELLVRIALESISTGPEASITMPVTSLVSPAPPRRREPGCKMAIEIRGNRGRFHGDHVETLGKDFVPRSIQDDDEVHSKLLEDTRREFGPHTLWIRSSKVGVRLVLVRKLVGRMLERVDLVGKRARRPSEIFLGEIRFQAGESAQKHGPREHEKARPPVRPAPRGR